MMTECQCRKKYLQIIANTKKIEAIENNKWENMHNT